MVALCAHIPGEGLRIHARGESPRNAPLTRRRRRGRTGGKNVCLIVTHDCNQHCQAADQTGSQTNEYLAIGQFDCVGYHEKSEQVECDPDDDSYGVILQLLQHGIGLPLRSNLYAQPLR
jgi:hypothetical protein